MLSLDVPQQFRQIASAPHRLWSSRQWCEFFRGRKDTLLAIPWQLGAELTPAERELLVPSLQVFQQGEAQEGGHFYRCARAHAEASGDFTYVVAHSLFMDEEKRHGSDLARFLALAGEPVLTEQSWLARAFCWWGSLGQIESTLRVILLSEIIALVYYAALWHATGSTVLRRLCAQILRDEKHHVRFQSERLALLRRRRPAPWLRLTKALDILLFSAAVMVCWCGHRCVLRAGGLNLATYWRRAWRRFNGARRKMDPCTYTTF